MAGTLNARVVTAEAGATVRQPGRTPAAPAALPAQVARLQRLAGNRGVAEMLAARSQPVAAPPAVQRYFLHTPKSKEVTGSQFQAQEKAKDAASFVDATTKQTTVKGPSGKRPPKLRVSDDGRLAIESSDLSTRQAKVFYAEPAVVVESNARLIETGSPYELFIDGGKAVEVPSLADPGTHALHRVLPRRPDSFDAATGTHKDAGMTMDIRATCDEVAQAIVGTGNIGDHPVLKKSIKTAIGFGEFNVAKYLLARESGRSADEAVTDAAKAWEVTSAHDAEIKAAVDKEMAAYDKAVATDVEERKAKGEEAVPDEERQRIGAGKKATATGAAKSEIQKRLRFDIADAYSKLLVRDPKLMGDLATELGINKAAQPEVGQAFGSIQMRGHTKIDQATGKERTLAEGGTWGSHYGGVVAKSGGDAVTLENYARNRENEGIAGATEKMYYFQMYGSKAGQTWHEVWSSASRRVVNPLTQVFGRDFRDVWSAQLAGIPRLESVDDDRGYAALLDSYQQKVKAATSRDEAMAAYRTGLLTLVTNRFTTYALRAEDVAVDAGVADGMAPYKLSIAPVLGKIDEWLAAGAALPKPGRLSRKKDTWPMHAEALRQLRESITDVRTYYAQRFPETGIEAGERKAQTAGAKSPAADKKAKQLEQDVRRLFRAHDLKETVVKKRHDHYAGEEVDASTNPMIADGRTAIAGLRKQGLTEAEIRSKLKEMLPSFSDQELDTYFLSGTTATPKVAYLDSTNRADYELTVAGGKLRQRGKDFDTSSMFSSGAGPGFSVFVMSPEGQIYANEHKPGLFHHSSFLAGLPTASAGELQVKKGALKMLTNKSGHYHPGARQTYQVLTRLKGLGVTLSSFALKVAGIPAESAEASWNGTYPTAREFVDRFTYKKP